MLAIDHVLVSDEIVEEKFVCDLSRCRGGCCVEGDGGAPLTPEETATLEEIYDQVAPYLSGESVREIQNRENSCRMPNPDGQRLLSTGVSAFTGS